MLRKPKTPTSDSPNTPTEAQRQQASRRLAVDHRRLKIAFADAYVELIGLREENGRLSELLQEAQRVIREMGAKLLKDNPAKDVGTKS